MKNEVVSTKVRIETMDLQKLPMCSEASIQHVSNSMESLRDEKASTPAFPLYGKSPNDVLEMWKEKLLKSAIPQWMKDYELSRITKFGPQGGHPAWKDVKPAFNMYQERNSYVRDSSLTNYVRDQVIRDYQKFHCQLVSETSVLENSKLKGNDLDTAAGWNTFHLKKNDPAAITEAKKLSQSGEWLQGYGYVFLRSNKQKSRIFMPMPFSSVLNQGRFYVPRMNAIQSSLRMDKHLSPWMPYASKIGYDNSVEFSNALINSKGGSLSGLESSSGLAHERKDLVFVQLDFDAMDTSTGYNQYANLVVPAYQAMFEKSLEQDIKQSLMFTVTAPLITPDGVMRGPHGTASGATVTNDGENIVNDNFQRAVLILIKNECKNLSIKYELLDRQLDGDDGKFVFKLANESDFENFEGVIRRSVAQASELYGLVFNVEKMHISNQYGLYLQRMEFMSTDGLVGAYPTILVLNSILNPENYVPKSKYDADYWELATLEKLENAKMHPLFHELIDFVSEGLKSHAFSEDIGRFKLILSKYDKYQRATIGSRPTWTRLKDDDGKPSILDFESVKYILSKLY